MPTYWRIEMHARNPLTRCARSWRAEIARDLFGAWTIRVAYGRIGSHGRELVKTVDSEAKARAMLKAALARRATARNRKGIDYREVEWIGNREV